MRRGLAREGGGHPCDGPRCCLERMRRQLRRLPGPAGLSVTWPAAGAWTQRHCTRPGEVLINGQVSRVTEAVVATSSWAVCGAMQARQSTQEDCTGPPQTRSSRSNNARQGRADQPKQRLQLPLNCSGSTGQHYRLRHAHSGASRLGHRVETEHGRPTHPLSQVRRAKQLEHVQKMVQR